MTLRTRLAAVAAMLLLLVGFGAAEFGPTASASTSVNTAQTTATNGCVVIPSLQIAVCIPRF